MSLFWRIFLLNGAILLLGPVTVSTPVQMGQARVIAAGLTAMLLANAAILRIALSPLQRLSRTMTTADLLHPGTRSRVTGPGEIADLTDSKRWPGHRNGPPLRPSNSRACTDRAPGCSPASPRPFCSWPSGLRGPAARSRPPHGGTRP
ncbi:MULTISPECIES: hypothetical protein [Streptomycetaceae]|uniref:hypothetical protein n=1 Tax=Embleya scabrispora TaxID=159449 RepID=UPI00039D646B